VSDTKKSKSSRVPTSLQPLAQVAARPSIATEWLSSATAEVTVTVLLLVLEGFVKETLSPDKMALVVCHAVNKMKAMGLSEDKEAQEVVRQFVKWAEAHRRSNPLSGMF
jgi:hypothetical protein